MLCTKQIFHKKMQYDYFKAFNHIKADLRSLLYSRGSLKLDK